MPGCRQRRHFQQTDDFTRGMVIGLRIEGWSFRQITADTNRDVSTVHLMWRKWLVQGNVACSRGPGAGRVTSAREDRRIRSLAVAALVDVQRLEWCRARATWMTEWRNVVLLDESRFCCSNDSQHIRVGRRRGERSNGAVTVEHPIARKRDIMVRDAIAYDSTLNLVRIQGTLNAQRYVQNELRTMLPWPAYSSDLSRIEHVWDVIGRRLQTLPLPCSNDQLCQMIEREWRIIPQNTIRNLIDSVPRRVSSCIAARGGSTPTESMPCQVIFSQFGLAIYQNDHQERRRFVEWAQNEIAVVPDFHKRILFSDEAHFWLNGYVNKQNCRISSEANSQVYVETPLHPEKLTVWCAFCAGGILLQKR
ncbi:transposable element Tcb1 transposase [Trichonephila clavipes]|uniref:Transposable element Tcb1 transposase n=1 Tax=Trichonephila clavipes TaxID=2585209 RepID=A0A8X6SS17_TRICX|nr:transposable element Tcb1 transposase [Trichonephila clavipes]